MLWVEVNTASHRDDRPFGADGVQGGLGHPSLLGALGCCGARPGVGPRSRRQYVSSFDEQACAGPPPPPRSLATEKGRAITQIQAKESIRRFTESTSLRPPRGVIPGIIAAALEGH